jgi:phospholipid/cholesterol/gamma-HCH transport system ATP-binding protein
VRNIAAGASAIDLKRGLDRAAQAAIAALRLQSRPVLSQREKQQVATVSAHNDASGMTPDDRQPPAIELAHVSLAFDDHVVLRDISFTAPRGSTSILLGASGSGKSIILKLVLGLLRPDAGRVLVDGQRVDTMSERQLIAVRAGIGMLFQENALFDSLTVAENVGYRLDEETDMPDVQVRRRVEEVLSFVGLAEYVDRMPSALSGGQRRRVAIARAMAAKPHVLLFDDPTSGLDPLIATTIADEIVKLRDLEQVTSIVVTHQIRDAFYIANHEVVGDVREFHIAKIPASRPAKAHFLLLHDGRIAFEGSAAELQASPDAYLREFLFMTLPPW